MPFPSIVSLPTELKKILPKHAQEMYVAAFNAAYEEYKEPQKRTDGDSREERAHAVAWSAVKKKYQKDDATGLWEALK